jgi:glycosyltransferase involved in cell wall biosynthesis
MKILITTQAVDLDDPVLAFFCRWLEEFALRCERVEVICLREGQHELPGNVRVHVLPRGRIARAVEVKRLAWGLRREYDAVFVHMNPEYLIVAGPLWKILRKRVVLWYTHRQVNLKLRVALLFASTVATAAPESFRMASPKVHAVGHGIDVERFRDAHGTALPHEPPRLICVGRITPIKRLEVLIEALALLRKRGILASAELVGAPAVPADHAYEARLRALAQERDVSGQVTFVGQVPNDQMPEHYAFADLSINLAPTGGIDKAVLESMAAGTLPVVANRAFEAYFGDAAPRLLFTEDDVQDLADKIQALVRAPDFPQLRELLAATARSRASIPGVVSAIMGLFI